VVGPSARRFVREQSCMTMTVPGGCRVSSGTSEAGRQPEAWQTITVKARGELPSGDIGGLPSRRDISNMIFI
jgi:hypothetical protein